MSSHKYSTRRVGVLGGSGYTGRELLRILRDHGGVGVAFATARSEAGQPTDLPGLTFAAPDDVDPGAVDLLFLCLPHGEAAPRVAALRNADVRIVDLTADHRPGSGREDDAVYGLPELHGPDLPGARLVANPGCYPTGVILALAPLCRDGLVDPSRPVIVNAASGVTGAGRSPRRDLLFAEIEGDFRAYALGNRHRHLGEMRAPFPGLRLLFTPHLLPVSRGILETIHLPVRGDVDAGAVREAWASAYGSSSLIRVAEPEDVRLSAVAETDRLLLSAVENDGLESLLTVSVALDNLGKGAAGQAVQNMNLMLGFAEERGLRC